MYTKVVEVEGESRLVFFARTDIKPGQELTYDYRYTAFLICLPVLTCLLVQYLLYCEMHVLVFDVPRRSYDVVILTSQRVSVRICVIISFWCVHQCLAACVTLKGRSSHPDVFRPIEDS